MIRLNEKFSGKYLSVFQGIFYISLSVCSKSEFVQEEYIKRTAQSFKSHKKIELEDIFKDLVANRVPRVLMYGAVGTGKSTATQTIAYKWGRGELWNQHFDFVFHLECRHLTPLIQDEETISFETLIMRYHPYEVLGDKNLQERLFKYITDNQDRILFIVDGLDELDGWDLVVKDHSRKIVRNTTDIAHLPVVIYSLIYGHFMQFCKVLVTSRPFEASSPVPVSRTIVTLGFDEESIDECSFAVCDYVRDIHQYITQYLQHRRQLYVHCVVPLNCVLLTALLSRDRKNNIPDNEAVDRLSQITTRIVLDFIHKRCENEDVGRYDLSRSQQESVHKLAKMAAVGLLAEPQTIIFTGEDLKDYGLVLTATRADPTIRAFLEVFKKKMYLVMNRIRSWRPPLYTCPSRSSSQRFTSVLRGTTKM